MTDTKDKGNTAQTPAAQPGKTTLGLGAKGTLSLKGGLSAPVRQNVTHGRSGASVAVEVRRKRGPNEASGSGSGEEETVLTNDEREARARAINEALKDSEKRKTTLPKRRTIENVKAEAEEQSKATQQDARSREMEEMARIEQDERKRPDATAIVLPNFSEAGRRAKAIDDEEESYRDRMKKAVNKAPAKRAPDDARRGGRLTVSQALSDFDRGDRGRSMAAQKRAREKARLAAMGSQEAAKKVFREVIVPEVITVGELANRMAEAGGDVIKALMKMGVMATINQAIDADTAELVIGEFGHKIKRVTEGDIEIGLSGNEDEDADLITRPPVVTIMGHVDHGKTSLLDALRSTDVVAGEAGGITQHIGAYQVTLESGRKITFLDTPGHEAFTEMRARGANVTDIVIIVVAANDSVMPQTIEAISHAKAAKVPIIIAINKIDLPDADPAKVRQQLLQYDVAVEEMGGDVLCLEVSAKKRINLDKLEETILLQADVLELRANPNREAQGVIIESRLEKGRGPVSTVLIQKGTLKIGNSFVAGSEFGKVRAIINDHGQNVATAGPGQPVEVLGLNSAPEAGDPFSVVADESKAREIADYRQRKRKDTQAAAAVKGRTTIEDLVARRSAGEKTSLPVVIKADVHGSIEAIAGSLRKMVDENEGIEVQVLHSGVGGITESDVTLARASGGLIIGFNVRANAQARALATRDGVDIRYYNIIYNVIDDAKMIMTSMLAPSKREEYLGQAQVLQVFNITKVGKVAGCKIATGMVKRGAKVRLLRDDVVIHEGMLKTLKRHKDEVKEVKEGMECGMAFEKYEDLKEGDIIECYEIIEEARTVT